MVLSTGRVLEHWHTGAMTAALGRARRASSRRRWPSCRRATCERLGIARGDMDPRGDPPRRDRASWCATDSDVPDGMVFMPFCYAEAAANLLTNPALDPFGKIPEFKFCAAQVEAARGDGRGGGVG